MPKNFARKTFDRWLKLKRRHFKYQPRIVKSRRDYFILKFDGIAPELACFISSRGDCMITVDYDDTFWDIILEFDLRARRNSRGEYYCDGCLPEYRKYYTSRKELWEKHCFEPLIEWTNENFNSSSLLCLWGDKEGSTAAYIKADHEEKDFTAIIPVLQSRRLK